VAWWRLSRAPGHVNAQVLLTRAQYHDAVNYNLAAKFAQIDEISSFVGCKETSASGAGGCQAWP
jgi:hypothetical protein